jgi:flagellin-like hook-associated protein FlgL
MAYSINTNIASLQSQNYLRVTSDFQDKTINRVTSGLRILSSGDDAAGLAIANSLRSDRSVLSQGVRNANDGLSTLQTIDGGMNNVSQLLDRARTLAAQSASGTFTGDRAVVNGEFSSVIAEIDRQAQSIGLNLGGEFARSLSVFIGGGKASGSTTAINNGSVAVDLSSCTVDSRSLGLTKLAATGGGDFLGANSVSAINTAAGNGNAAGAAIFEFYGAGFGDYSTPFTLSVTMGSTIVDGETLVDAINGAINGLTADSTVKKAFKDAGIQAGLSSDSKTLVFTSASSAFQVQGNNAKAAAFLGAFAAAPVGNVAIAANRLTANGVVQVGSTPFAWDNMADGNQAITVSTTDSAGSLHSLSISLAFATTGATLNAALTHINSQLQASNDVELKKILAVEEGTGTTMRFVSTNKSFTVTLGVDDDSTAANEGIGGAGNQGTIINSTALGSATTADISTESAAQAAVNALSTAISTLGSAQAIVGKGQNQLSYAINLAQSQISNLAAAESRIRDADLAMEAANLTKAQILQQAGIAALAQANAAPQVVLSLLRA